MKHTDYLNKVLAYYVDEGFYFGDGGKWELAHTPMPRALGDDTVPLLHQHHVIHDLWQSAELDECHFFPPNAKKVLYSPDFWPTSWFELCDIFEELSLKGMRKAAEIGRKSLGFEGLSAAGKKGGLKGGKIGWKITDQICRTRGNGIYSKETQLKGGKSTFEQKKGAFAPKNLGKGAKNTNAQIWECLVTGFQSKAGPLSCFQKKRGIDTKLRKRIK